ncbi:MAG: tRNA (guanosine(46)-N7)-methyltransferase TrmB [Deltaproteobacteria bacterium]|nr:tRNA (guanosine(46)-N7)-methyltransferase TrmB [Deltaproteobacteria bacterium]
MGRSLKYEIPGDDPRVSPDEIASSGFGRLFARARARAGAPRRGAEVDRAGIAGMATLTEMADLTDRPERVDPEAPGDTPPRRLVLEIGFGRGEFLLALAEAAPDTDFVGIEVSWKRALKMARKVARAHLPNVLLTVGRGEEALRDAFAPGSLSALWVNFSDPWPKLRHAERRLVKPSFAALAARALAPGGTLYVATDDVPYAQQIDEVLSAEKGLVNRYAPLAFLPEVPGRMRTGYEAQWRAESRPLHFFAYAAPVDPARGGEGMR